MSFSFDAKKEMIAVQNKPCCAFAQSYGFLLFGRSFGKNAIMCQGTLGDCIAYLERNGVSYFEECWKRNRGRDVQVSFRMYRVEGRNGDNLILRDREGFAFLLAVSDLAPSAPNTFKLSPGMRGEKVSTVKLMDARAW